MDGLRLDVQDPLGPGGGEAPRLLDQEGDGVALVQESQLQKNITNPMKDFCRDKLFCPDTVEVWIKLSAIMEYF